MRISMVCSVSNILAARYRSPSRQQIMHQMYRISSHTMNLAFRYHIAIAQKNDLIGDGVSFMKSGSK